MIQRWFAEVAVWCREIAIPAVVLAVLVTASAPANNVYSRAVADATPATIETTPDAANVPLSGEPLSREARSVEPMTTAAIPPAAVAAETAGIEPPKTDTPKSDSATADTPEIDTPKADTPRIDTPKIDTSRIETPKIETPTIDLASAGALMGECGAKPARDRRRGPQ